MLTLILFSLCGFIVKFFALSVGRDFTNVNCCQDQTSTLTVGSSCCWSYWVWAVLAG